MKDYLDLYFVFFKMGAVLFGGGYSMLPMLIRELVDKRHWTSEEEILDYFAIAQCTPGVIAVNTATFIGNKRKGVLGGAVATLGVITVPTILILLIATVLMRFWSQPAVAHAFNGVRVAVSALIAASVIKLCKSNVKDWVGIAMAVLGFVLIAIAKLSPFFVVLIAAIVGFVLGRVKK